MSARIVVKIDPDIEDLIPGFLANRRRDVDSLKSLVANEDYAAVRVIGHSMKGAGGGYGFDVITEIGDTIESAALRVDGDAIMAAAAELADYLARVEPVYD
ncbi:MAG: Hpt domain-containing protein [Gammaproteobacteria bacterium]|nr:Hpt domain-containing protein [Gammaproteobacteria bacterium]